MRKYCLLFTLNAISQHKIKDKIKSEFVYMLCRGTENTIESGRIKVFVIYSIAID